MTLYPRIQIFTLFEKGYIHLSHLTGALRGLICYGCDNLLGMANDGPKILMAGAKYILDNKELWLEEVRKKFQKNSHLLPSAPNPTLN